MDKLAGPASIKPNMFTQQSFIRGGSAPWSTLTTLYTILDRKGTLFLYLPLGNGTPFKYLILNVAPLSVVVNALTALKYDKITRLGNFLDFITAINSSVSPCGCFYRRKDSFTYS